MIADLLAVDTTPNQGYNLISVTGTQGAGATKLALNKMICRLYEKCFNFYFAVDCVQRSHS